MLVRRVVIFAPLALIVLVGCAATAPPTSGWLKDYSGFVNQPGETGVWIYRSPRHTYFEYDKVMIDPIVAEFDAQRGHVLIDPKSLDELATYMHESVKKSVSGRYPVVESPGKGVLRLRVALTHLVPSAGPDSAQAASGFAGELGISFGSASFEGEMSDSVSGERVHAFIAISQRGTTVPSTASDRWRQAIAAMDEFGRRFRKALDEAHQKPAR